MITRRTFAKIALLSNAAATAAQGDTLQSEFLFDLTIQASGASPIGDRTVVAVGSGTFDGPKLKGTIVPPSGDWIVQRPDGTRALDVRLLLQTHDGEKIFMSWRGVSYTPPGGSQYARILATFEANRGDYVWLNHIVAVGVYRPAPGRIVYRVYQIL